MNISIIFDTFPMYRKLPLFTFEVPLIEKVEKKDTSDDQLFSVIFAPDPFTRLPTSDVAVYLSDKVDPSIREFVGSQLLRSNGEVGGVPDVVADDLLDYVRGADESVADYAVRIRDLVAKDNEIISKSQQIEQVELKTE